MSFLRVSLTILKEFTLGSNVAKRVRWLFGQGAGPPDTVQTDKHPNAHGTCMLDKIAGYKFGVAKNVNPVVVRAVRSHPLSFLDTVRQINADYQVTYNRDPNNARAIINMSWGFTATVLGPLKDTWVDELRVTMQTLISRGATIVVPAGNSPGNPVRQSVVSGHDSYAYFWYSPLTSGLRSSPVKVAMTGFPSSSLLEASTSTMAGTENFGTDP